MSRRTLCWHLLGAPRNRRGGGGAGSLALRDEVQKKAMYASAWLELISGSVSKATAACSGTVVA